MRGLSFIEIVAVLFTGLAGLASAVQAYVSWETRGEVSRAIVFAQRLDACAKVVAALEPFVAKARTDARKIVASGSADGRYSLPMYYYRQSSGNAGFEAEHGPRLQRWREAAAGFRIVGTTAATERLGMLDRAIADDIPAGNTMSRQQLTDWLERLEVAETTIVDACKAML